MWQGPACFASKIYNLTLYGRLIWIESVAKLKAPKTKMGHIFVCCFFVTGTDDLWDMLK